MDELSEAARTRLQRSGWYAHRVVDTAPYVAALEAEGHPVSPAALAFLGCFGGLEIQFKHFATGEDTLSIDPLVAADVVPRQHIEEYGKRVGAPLCPIGEAFSGHYVVVIDPAGRMFAGFDDTLVLLGNSPEAALDNLCNGRQPELLSRHWGRTP